MIDAAAYVAEAQTRAWDVPDVPASTPTIPVRSVGIIGAGTMGGGIAMNFANIGVPVTVVEQAQAALDRGFGVIRTNYERSAKRGRFPMEEAERRIALITGALDMSALADCDLVIEAVFEDMGVKKSIFERLDGIVKDGAVLATNTSGLDVNEIAAVTKRPEVVIGLHFFSPANVMKLVEVVRGDETSKEVIATSMDLAKRIGKVAALVGVCPGFVGNRMLYARGLQSEALLKEGVMPWRVDGVLQDFGFKMGPYAMADLAGLDIGWSREASRGVSMRDRLCEADRRGQKNGRGWYDYDAERKATPSAEVEVMVRDFAAQSGTAQREVSDAEILDRCLLPMVNEGARILSEGIAIRPSDIDVVWLSGYNWPAAHGGPMYWADAQGLPEVVERMERYARDHGPPFTPAPLLRTLAAQGRSFGDLKDGEAPGLA